MRHDSIAFEIEKSIWIRQKQLDMNIKGFRYDRNKDYLYGEFKLNLVAKWDKLLHIMNTMIQ